MKRLRTGPSDVGGTREDRRALLMTAALVPAAFVAVRLCAAVGTGLDELAGSVRPPACGSSATRCAACGAGDHTMLDARCPLAPPVRHRGDG